MDLALQRYADHPQQVERILTRAGHFLPFIAREVSQRGMPAEIALLPAVESGYWPFAYSPSGAAGLWQFMPATGARYGLQGNWWMDTRRDPIQSTRAALDFLGDLNTRFDGDWLLALAAYNCGPGRVARALEKNRRQGLPLDYWHLDLPRETDHYVPRLLAFARIVADPASFGVRLPEIDADAQLVVADTGGQLDLRAAARLADMDIEQLLLLNAAFNRGSTPPDGPHQLILPADRSEGFQRALAQLPEEQRIRWRRHRVRSGETLSHIAVQHGVKVADLRVANELDGSLIRAGQDLVVPLSNAPLGPQQRIAAAGHNRSRIKYRVRRGDSLYKIASRFNVKITDLQRWNSLDGTLIRPGQRLSLVIDPTAQSL
jgi:membrane-bound lytic murein transglycosylase D